MAGIEIDVKFDLGDVKRDIDNQVFKILDNVVRNDIPQILKQEGFGDKGRDYKLTLRNKGRESIRELSSVNARYLTLGSERSPLLFTFSSNDQANMEKSINAAFLGFEQLIRRAPYKSGEYKDSIDYWTYRNGTMIKLTSGLLKVYEFKAGDSIMIASLTDYSTTIERGFATKYYHRDVPSLQKPNGIFLWTARWLRRKYGADLSIRFRYTKIFNKIVPAIEIAPKGTFASNDYRLQTTKGRRR